MTRLWAWLAGLIRAARDDTEAEPAESWPWDLDPYPDHPDTEGSDR